MANRWRSIRDNVVTAIKALPAVNGTPVVKLGIPVDILKLGHRQAIGVCLSEDVWDVPERGISDFRDNPATITVPVVIMATSEYPPESAQADDGKIEDLSAAILGSNVGDIGPGIRGVNVGDETTGIVTLVPEKSEIAADQSRSAGTGGQLLKIITFRTTVLPL